MTRASKPPKSVVLFVPSKKSLSGPVEFQFVPQAETTTRPSARAKTKGLLNEGVKRSIDDKGTTKKIARAKYTIGVLPVDVAQGYLPAVFEKINAAQRTFEFQMIVASLRAGLDLSGDRTREIIRGLKRKITRDELDSNVYAPDLYKVARPIHKEMGFDLTGLLVTRMIIDVGWRDDSVQWNLFSSASGQLFIASTFDLRRYADAAGRTFEACLAAIVLPQVFASLFDRVEYHSQTLGCLFDECDNRDDIVKGLKAMRLSDEALALFPMTGTIRNDAIKCVEAIGNYKRKGM